MITGGFSWLLVLMEVPIGAQMRAETSGRVGRFGAGRGCRPCWCGVRSFAKIARSAQQGSEHRHTTASTAPTEHVVYVVVPPFVATTLKVARQLFGDDRWRLWRLPSEGLPRVDRNVLGDVWPPFPAPTHGATHASVGFFRCTRVFLGGSLL